MFRRSFLLRRMGSARTWPTAPQAGQPLGVALPDDAAADLRLSPGSVLDLHYAGASTAVVVRVTGLFRPRSQASSYWRLDQIGPAGVKIGGGFASYGPRRGQSARVR